MKKICARSGDFGAVCFLFAAVGFRFFARIRPVCPLASKNLSGVSFLRRGAHTLE